MATVLANDDVLVVQAVCYDVQSTQIGLNVTKWGVSGVANNITDDDVADLLDTSWQNAYKTFMSSLSEYRGISVQLRRAPGTYPPVVATKSSGVGLSGATQLPLQTTGLIRFQTQTALVGATSKKYSVRGRIYPAFPSTVNADANGRMNAVGLANVTGIMVCYTSPQTLTVLTRTCTLTLQVETSDAVTQYAQVTGKSAVQAFATQRRRGELGRTNPIPF